MKRFCDHYITVLILLGLVLGSNGIQAQQDPFLDHRIKFEHFSSKDGLMHNSITALFQDSKGFIWIGTRSGLYRYDGYSFEFFRNDPYDQNSLVDNEIKAIYEDDSNQVWIGTPRGLCWYSYNHNHFERTLLDVDKNEEISFNFDVNNFFKDSKSNFWIATSYGLYKLNREAKKKAYKIKVYLPNQFEKGAISYHNIKCVTEDSFGKLWFGHRKGLDSMELIDGGEKFNRIVDANLAGVNVVDILVDEQTMWLATKEDLKKIRLYDKEVAFEKQIVLDLNPSKKGITPSVSSLALDHKKQLWIGTKNHGLYLLNNENQSIKHFSKSKNKSHGLVSNVVNDILVDRTGLLWMGTVRGGLSKVNLHKKNISLINSSEHSLKALNGEVISTICQDSKQRLWVGVFGGGINIISPTKGELTNKIFNETNSRIDSDVNCILEDDFGYIWLGTRKKELLQCKLDESGRLKTRRLVVKDADGKEIDYKLSHMYLDKNGMLWLAGDNIHGLISFKSEDSFSFKPNYDQYKKVASKTNWLKSHLVNCFYEDSDGMMWFGTEDAGLFKVLRGENGAVDQFISVNATISEEEKLDQERIFTIHEDSNKDIWIGTFGGGLLKLSKSERNKNNPKLTRYGMKQGLSSDEIYAVSEDNKGKLWMSTNNGINSLDLTTEVVNHFDLSDGLQALNFRKNAFHKNKKGTMFFGGINGLNILNPDFFENQPQLPEIQFTGFKLFNENVSVNEEVLGGKVLTKGIQHTEEISLNYKQNVFTVVFSAMHFASPSKNRYQYKLEGFDQKWQTLSNNSRSVTYANLKPGQYEFLVKASNNDNLWMQKPKTLSLTILPPFWKTNVAYVLYLMFFALLLYLFRRYVLVNQEYKNNLRIKEIEKDKIREINKMKLEFFTNISHEFKTPLSLILGPLQSILKNEEAPLEIKENLSLMQRNANQLLKLINQVMEFRKMENKEMKINLSKRDLISFSKDVFQTFKSMADEKEVVLNFESEIYTLETYLDWDKIEKIINNLLSNSIKYSESGGQVKLKLYKDSLNKGVIQVEDNGIGIPKNQLAMIFDRFYQIDSKSRSSSMGSGIGLALTKALVDLHGGEIEVKSEEGKGSIFTVKLPLKTTLESTIGSPIAAKNPALSDFEASLMNAESQSNQIPQQTLENKNDTEEYKEVEAIGAELEVSKEEPESKDKSIILLVEDNPDMQKFIKNAFAREYKVLLASDGEAGMKIAENKVPDIIVSDVMMPKKDGVTMCKELKNNTITSHIPVILLTARGSIAHRLEGIEVGADAYIPKPFDMEHLKLRVQKLIEQRKLLKEKFSSGNLKLDSEITGVSRRDKMFLQKAEEAIEKNLSNSEFSVEDFGREMAYSRMQLYRKFKSIKGMSANEFIREYRIKKAALLLQETDLNISETMYQVGFINRSYFTKCFKQMFELPPREYIKKFRVDFSEDEEVEDQ